MADRERFFRLNPAYLPGVLLAVVGGWISQGPVFVALVVAASAVVIGVYYLIWRWLKDRSS